MFFCVVINSRIGVFERRHSDISGGTGQCSGKDMCAWIEVAGLAPLCR